MSKMVKKSLAVIALLLATNTAIAQVPVLKKPVLAPQTKPAIPPVMLRTPITVVNAAGIASNSPNRGEAARRLKAQNVPVAAALTALRGAFGVSTLEEGSALRAAGYATPDWLAAMKQLDGLDAASMFHYMTRMNVPQLERGPLLRQLYALDFDALLATMRVGQYGPEAFGYALDAMDYDIDRILQTGYRYFAGGFSNPGGDGLPYPGPGAMYDLLKRRQPLAGRVQIDHFTLWARLLATGYPAGLTAEEVRFGAYHLDGHTADPVADCVASSNLDADDRPDPPERVNSRLLVRIAPDGGASHSDRQRQCLVQFLDRLRARGVARSVAVQLADRSVLCLPQANPACPARLAEVVQRMVTEADYPAEKN